MTWCNMDYHINGLYLFWDKYKKENIHLNLLLFIYLFIFLDVYKIDNKRLNSYIYCHNIDILLLNVTLRWLSLQ